MPYIGITRILVLSDECGKNPYCDLNIRCGDCKIYQIAEMLSKQLKDNEIAIRLKRRDHER